MSRFLRTIVRQWQSEMSGSKALRKVVVLGGGVEAALATAVLAKSFRALQTEVVCFQSAPNSEQITSLALDATIVELHGLLAFSETDFMRACNATYDLGPRIRVPDRNIDFVRADAVYGTSLGQVPFCASYVRQDLDESRIPFDRFSLAAQLGRAAKFCHPGSFPTPIEGRFRYGYQAHADLYRDYLLSAARHYGANVESVDALTIDVSDVFADLIIDARTGRPQHAMEGLVQGAAIAVSTSLMEWGTGSVRLQASLQSSSEDLVLDASCVSGSLREESDLAAPWNGKVVTLGAGAFPFSQLDAVPSRFLAGGLLELMALLPVRSDMAPERSEYNRRMGLRRDRLRDLQALHTWLAAPPEDRDAVSLSPENQRRIEQFLARGRVITYDFDPIGSDAFAAMFFGYGLTAEATSLVAMSMPIAELETGMARFSAAIDRAVASVPDLGDYMARIHGETNRPTSGSPRP